MSDSRGRDRDALLGLSVMAVASFGVMIWVAAGASTAREVAGVAVSVLFTMILVVQVFDRAVAFGQGWGEGAERTVSFEAGGESWGRVNPLSDAEIWAEIEGRNTGTWQWTGDGLGDEQPPFTVRWDPVVRVYFIRQQWPDGHVDEMAWPDVQKLVEHLIEMERVGTWAPARDNPTRAIRARLDLPGWWEEFVS